jgi:hypothetical protein
MVYIPEEPVVKLSAVEPAHLELVQEEELRGRQTDPRRATRHERDLAVPDWVDCARRREGG